MTSRRLTKRISSAALSLLALAVSSAPSHALAHDDAEINASQHRSHAYDRKTAGELAKLVREVTARYRDVRVAEADHYNLLFGCVSGAEWGAMGLHYVNLDLVGDGELDPTRPEIVIYEPLPNGGRKLIGADYLVYAKDWHARNGAGTPQINGQLMHLIESPNRYGLESFYTLHVWAWKDNPTGAFTNWHANVSCDAFDDPEA
jgi:hypothetical protein